MSTVLITGAARGLGLDFARRYAAKGWKVLACARKPDGLRGIEGDVHHHPLEVTDYKAVKALAKKLSGEAIDVLICNAGISGERGADAQSLGSLDPDVWRKVFEVNALAPLMMAEAFAEHVARSRQRKLIAITSILGSIANNNGGRYIYRASKTALNMEWSCLARDLAGKNVICVALHPGWVQTDMGGSGAPTPVADSVRGILREVDKATLADSGEFLNWKGNRYAW